MVLLQYLVICSSATVMHVIFSDGRRFTAKSKRGSSEPTSMLFVGSLPKTATETALKRIFSGCDKARIMFDKNDESKG